MVCLSSSTTVSPNCGETMETIRRLCARKERGHPLPACSPIPPLRANEHRVDTTQRGASTRSGAVAGGDHSPRERRTRRGGAGIGGSQPDFGPRTTTPHDGRSGSVNLDAVVAEPASRGHIGGLFAVAYLRTGCRPVEKRAPRAVVTEARERTRRRPAPLGVGIGDPVGAYGTQDRAKDAACTNRSGFSYGSDFGGLGVTRPPFDAATAAVMPSCRARPSPPPPSRRASERGSPMAR